MHDNFLTKWSTNPYPNSMNVSCVHLGRKTRVQYPSRFLSSSEKKRHRILSFGRAFSVREFEGCFFPLVLTHEVCGEAYNDGMWATPAVCLSNFVSTNGSWAGKHEHTALCIRPCRFHPPTRSLSVSRVGSIHLRNITDGIRLAQRKSKRLLPSCTFQRMREWKKKWSRVTELKFFFLERVRKKRKREQVCQLGTKSYPQSRMLLLFRKLGKSYNELARCPWIVWKNGGGCDDILFPSRKGRTNCGRCCSSCCARLKLCMYVPLWLWYVSGDEATKLAGE